MAWISARWMKGTSGVGGGLLVWWVVEEESEVGVVMVVGLNSKKRVRKSRASWST